MSFNEQLPDWEAPGTEPPASKRKSGWAPSDKPPADYFNWLFNRIYRVLKELREKAVVKTEDGKVVADRIVDGAATDAAIGNRTISDATAPTSNTGLLGTLLNGMAYMIKSITGEASWRTAPIKSLKSLNADLMDHMNAADPHTGRYIPVIHPDERGKVKNPSQYSMGTFIEFANAASIELLNGGNYALVITRKPWNDDSGGLVHQTAHLHDGSVWHRSGSTASKTWGAWKPAYNVRFKKNSVGSPDVHGQYAVWDYKRSDSTLYARVIFSNPDTNGKYRTEKIDYYNMAGTAIIETETRTLAYDSNGVLISDV